MAAGGTTAVAPWPGQIPPPAPALVHLSPLPAELVSSGGEPVRVSGRGLLDRATRPPVGGRQPLGTGGRLGRTVAVRRALVVPLASPGARLQVVSPAVAEEMAGEVARLLVAERGRWWVEATYG